MDLRHDRSAAPDHRPIDRLDVGPREIGLLKDGANSRSIWFHPIFDLNE
jgi:hypothetical protein